jgi:hypothetical protein
MPVQGTVKTIVPLCWRWLGNCCLRPQATVLKSSPAPRVNSFDFPEQAWNNLDQIILSFRKPFLSFYIYLLLTMYLTFQVILDYILPFHSIQLFLDRIILSFRKPFLSFYIYLLLISDFLCLFFFMLLSKAP